MACGHQDYALRSRHPWRFFMPRPEARPTSFQQPKEVGKKGRSPANLLIQFHLHLIFKPTWRAHPCAHQALSRHRVWSFDKAQLKSGKLESRGSPLFSNFL